LPVLQGASVVHLAPEGLLHKIAFAALPVSSDSVLLDITEIRQYASVRQVDAGSGSGVSIDRAFIAGHADFNAGEAKSSANPWSELPGTANEIEAIQQFFKTKGKKAEKVDLLGATETAVRSLGEPSPDIIHIATHGFFLPEPENFHHAGQQTSQPDAAFLSEFADPLLRSGIVLAGANKYWTGNRPANEGDDGILTAFELAQLNWDNTKVVTLSACETGLGDVQDGEGVFGLKRAIKLAGARYTIVSLWQVPDAETAELMSVFYDNLLSGLSVRMAFYNAQTAMRKKYKPFAWAAFVLSE
jgi:CHAT domain-containing protein